jgi:bifunctional non-homologous end joining protein LigD
MENLQKYNKKRDFAKTTEPKGKKEKTHKLRFCVQHHIARKDHYDFRLEYDGILLSWAIPKGPSYNPKDKRLAVKVENHPVSYRNFEGIIPDGSYGAGTVMLWDLGTYEEIESFSKTIKSGYLKFKLKGSKLKGKWTLVNVKDNNWLLIKENDGIKLYDDIKKLPKSIKTNRTMSEITNNKKNNILNEIDITSPDKIIYKNTKTTKLDVLKYYNKVSSRMIPYIKNRYLSTVRMPNGSDGEKFFKKHFSENKNLTKIKNSNYYYISNTLGLLTETQLNSFEYHVGCCSIYDKTHPDIMVFDLDPDEKLSIDKVRRGVKDLKKILDDLKLKSYLKTSGGKGYHVVVPLNYKVTWNNFEKIAYDIAKLMVTKYPDKYTINIRKKERKGKIFIDYLRNSKSATSVAPYSLRARKNPTVSMPIKWSELDKIKPDEIDINEALKRLRRKDPWQDFF